MLVCRFPPFLIVFIYFLWQLSSTCLRDICLAMIRSRSPCVISHSTIPGCDSNAISAYSATTVDNSSNLYKIANCLLNWYSILIKFSFFFLFIFIHYLFFNFSFITCVHVVRSAFIHIRFLRQHFASSFHFHSLLATSLYIFFFFFFFITFTLWGKLACRQHNKMAAKTLFCVIYFIFLSIWLSNFAEILFFLPSFSFFFFFLWFSIFFFFFFLNFFLLSFVEFFL